MEITAPRYTLLYLAQFLVRDIGYPTVFIHLELVYLVTVFILSLTASDCVV